MKTKNNNATNVANENVNEVMNQSIVRLNEFKAVKLASLSKYKRPVARFNKEVANYLLNNWDDVAQLKTCINAMRKDMPEGCEEVMQIYENRINELEPKKSEPKAKTEKKAAEPKQEKAKAAEPKKQNVEKGKRGRKATHYIGEVHPKNPNWIWMEYAPGKYDWKSIRGKQGAEQFPDRTPVETKGEKKESVSKAGNAKGKQSKKQSKAEKKEAAVAKMTLDELLAKPTPSGLSKSQQNALKALKRGFRLRKDGKSLWLTNSEGENISVDKAVIEALQRRFNIDYYPKGIWMKK